MSKGGVQMLDDKKDGFFSVCNLGSQWSLEQNNVYPGGLFASVGQMGIGFGVSPDSPSPRDNGGIKAPFSDFFLKYLPSQEEIRVVGVAEGEAASKTKKKVGLKLKIKVSNPSLRRLISGAIAGAVSRTCVAPLETIRTHLMVGSSGSSTLEVFNNIMQTDGWKGLFRGNFVNVIRVAPSKAIEGNWMIKVRLTSKGNMRTYKNARGEGCVFNVELTDEDGTQIQATMFNEAARKFYEKFQLGKVYYISRGTLKVANKQFKTVQNDYEMTLNENSVVEEASNEETFIPETKFNFVPIDQLGPYVNGRELVDHTCIDCDTCRWMAPQVFTRVGEMSAVYKQPTSSEDRLKALQALLSCPTSSIRTEVPPPDILEAQKTFPIPVDEKNLPGVYHCGYHSEKSYGAASYLIIHPGGNILIDSPRFTEKLAKEIETMGGVRYLFLTHKDDVADHAKWATRFSCDRILHSEDVEICTADVEMKLEGNGPWSLGDDIMLVHAPGHTEGTVCLLYKPLKILFTGDHLIMTESGLSIIEMYNKYSVPKQVDSVQKLIQFDFDWIIPGHGRRIEFKDVREKNTVLEAFVREKCNQYSSSYK